METNSAHKLQTISSDAKLSLSWKASEEMRAAFKLNKYISFEENLEEKVEKQMDSLREIHLESIKKSTTAPVRMESLNDYEFKDEMSFDQFKTDIFYLISCNSRVKRHKIVSFIEEKNQLLNLRENTKYREASSEKKKSNLSSTNLIQYTPGDMGITFIEVKNSFYIDDEGNKIFYSKKRNKALAKTKNVYDSLSSEEIEDLDYQAGDKFLIYPESRFKIAWDAIMILIILYIMSTLPVSLAFEVLEYKFLDVVSDVFFIVDLIFNFFIPVKDEFDNLITSYKVIARKYLTSWFLVDCFSSIPISILLLVIDSDANNLKVGKFTRLSKLYKFTRFLKLFFLLKLFKKNKSKQKQNMFSKYKKDNTSKNLRLFAFFIVFLLICHMFACMFVVLTEFQERNWIDELENKDSFGIYFDSLYFVATTVFTIGYGDIVAVTVLERIYVITVMFFGILSYSFAISSISSMIMSNDVFTESYMQRLQVFNSIREHFHVDSDGIARIERYINYTTKINKKEKYSFIFELPTYIKEKLLFLIFREVVNNYRFLCNKQNEFIFSFLQLIKPFRVLKGEYVAYKGENAKEMYFVDKGRLNLSLCSKFDNLKIIDIYKFESYGDILILTGKKHPLNLICKSKISELYMLQKPEFDSMLEHFPEEMKQNFMISAYNFAGLLDILEIKIQKISYIGESFASSAYNRTKLIDKAKQAIRSDIIDQNLNFMSKVNNVKVNQTKKHRRLIELENITELNCETKNFLKRIMTNEFSDQNTVKKIKKTEQFMERITGYNKKRKEQPDKFIKRNIKRTSKKKKLDTLKRLFNDLRG